MKILIAGIALWGLVGCATSSQTPTAGQGGGEAAFERYSVTRYPYPKRHSFAHSPDEAGKMIEAHEHAGEFKEW